MSSSLQGEEKGVPVASVVIPTRNRARMLEACLMSLTRLELPEPWEVIVIDDGSTDDTPATVERVGAQAAPIVPIRYERRRGGGLNAARNCALKLARSDLVCLLDDDVEVSPGWLSALLAGARAHPEADVLGGPIRLRIEGREPRHCRGDRLPETELDLGREPVWDQKLWGANFAFRRRTFDRVGAFDETLFYGDEEEWEERVLAAGGHTLYVPEAWLWHRRTAAELGHWYLLRRQYRIGYSQVPYRLRFGHRVTVGTELWRVVRGIGHAVLLGCFYGLLRASRHMGALRRLRELRREAVAQRSAPGAAA